MAYTPRLISKTIPLSAHQLFKMQVGDVFDGIRAAQEGKQFLPAQFGGIYGQREMLREKSVIDITRIQTA